MGSPIGRGPGSLEMYTQTMQDGSRFSPMSSNKRIEMKIPKHSITPMIEDGPYSQILTTN